MTTIGQLMNKSFAAIGCDATVAEAVAVLTQHQISGAPVVGDEGELVGMISELELFDVAFDSNVKDTPVSEYMAVEVKAVASDVPISLAAQLFALYSFRQLPVIEKNRLVGTITRLDLMNHALRTNHGLIDPLLDLIPSLASHR